MLAFGRPLFGNLNFRFYSCSMSCRTRSCENSAKYAQNMYCKCKIYNQEPSHPRCGVGEIDYLKDLKLCHCIKDLPYPRAFPVKCCNPVVKKTKIKEKYRDGELERQTEERYVAEYCSSKKECVELRYPPKKLPRSSTLPKYLRTDDCKSENCDPPTTYYQPARRKCGAHNLGLFKVDFFTFTFLNPFKPILFFERLHLVNNK
ncbi:hypothetical protein ECG_07577 [Echinococcus granulosus]|uniref:Expressed conserved protein n=1 Tax=Echinococcus granulosus TaxID=6210 RepID=A0A068WWE1_ECHGR|nr:hypothetical protein ECG_07577 [Echinococcus granulosus]CDS24160.1 expressed conserved protein [Echinococcus granulosus]